MEAVEAMEANLEAYLAKKGIEYEKVTKQYAENIIEHYYILEKFVEFDDEFNFMNFTVDDALLGKDEYVNKLLNKLDEDNIKYKEVLVLDKPKHDYYYFNFSIQCEIEEIIFCISGQLLYENIVSQYKYRKFIKYNTTIDLNKIQTMKYIT